MSDMTVEEQQSVIKNKKIFDNAVVTSNIIELVAGTLSRVNGKDVAYTSGKDNLSRKVLNNLVSVRLKNKLLEVK